MQKKELKKLSKKELTNIVSSRSHNTKSTKRTKPIKLKEGYEINPTTGRQIKINGPTYRKIHNTAKEGYVINPKTGRQIKINGSTYRKIHNKSKEGYVINPKTGRFIKIDGLVHRRMRKEMQQEIKMKEPEIYSMTVLLFRRVGESSKMKKIAFTSKDGYRYILIAKRILNISMKKCIDLYLNKRIYRKEDGKYNEQFTELIDQLISSIDFKELWDKCGHYTDCIIIKSASKCPNLGENVDVLEEELHLTNTEMGVYDKYLNFDLNQEVLSDTRANSCFVNLIVSKFEAAFGKVRKDGTKYYRFNLTHESLCEICGINYQEDNIGLSVNKSLAFFKKFRIGLCVYGPFGRLLKYSPEHPNKKINPRNLYIYIHNKHCYEINDNIKKFEQVVWRPNDDVSSELKSLKVSNEYYIRDTNIHTNRALFIDDCEQMIRYLDDKDNDEIKLVTFVYNEDTLDTFLFEIIEKMNYTPEINFNYGKIMTLKLKYNKIIAVITAPDIKQNDVDMEIDEKSYETFHKVDDEFYKGLLQKNHLSCYNQTIMDLENVLKISPMGGYFDNCMVYNELLGIDSRKAYTSDFMNIEFYPVFNHFDVWQSYDGHAVEDYTQYIVETKRCHPILSNAKFSRCYGIKLNKIRFNDVEILYYRRPSNLVKSNSEHLVKAVYESDLPLDCKKFIVNKNLGLIEKKRNVKTITKVFKNYDEAFYYQNSLDNGQIYTITGNSINTELEELEEEEKNKLYLLCISEERTLINGFLPIKELVYDIRSIKNYMTYKKLIRANIEVRGIKTDSLLIDNSRDNKSKVKKLFDFSNKIGCFKLETCNYLIDKKLQWIENELPQIAQITITEHEIKDERDTDEINNVFKKYNTFIKGSLPGVGKTTCAKMNPYIKTLFVSPYNKLCQELRKSSHDAVTLNMLLGIGIDDKHIKMKNFNIEPYDCIVFDEILLYNPYQLYLIKMFMKKNVEKRYLCTGDVDQRKPFTFGTNNIKDQNNYQLWCLNQMFPHQLTLSENKRLNKSSDKRKLIVLKRDIFDLNKDVISTFKRHGIKVVKTMKEVTTIKNICLFNFRCDQVNKHVAKNVVERAGFYSGLELVCKKHYKNKNDRLYVNYHYVLKSIGDKYFVVNEPVENKDIRLDVDKLKYFKLPYANTCDSVQGLTIKDKITIFDCNTPYVDRYFIWTALTRGTNFKNVQIYEHSQKEVMSLNESWVKLYFKNKIEGYRSQDRAAGRKNDKDYIDIDWIQLQLEKCTSCPLCNTLFEATIKKDKTVNSNITVDRIDNKLPHVKSNCRLMCLRCNVRKR
ncbi:TPA_asm: S1H [Trichoplax MELD virus]|nr:TPA_asm: S1H [Trichoplax MELD virus]